MEPLLEAFECIGGPYAREKERSARGQIDGQNHARAGMIFNFPSYKERSP